MATGKKPGDKKVKIGVSLPESEVQALRAAVYHAQRTEPSISMSMVLARGVVLARRELERKYGSPDDSKPVKLRRGRRLTKPDD